jgi:4'-phosphopantetheinyl transferase
MSTVRMVAVADRVYSAAAPVAALVDAPVAPADRAVTDASPRTRRSERLAARALLRRLLAEVVGGEAAAAPFAADARGRPFVAGRPDLGVSLSHSGGWVAAAVLAADGGVGVDIQVPLLPSDRLLRRCCGSGAARLARLSERRRSAEFAWIWSVQEACVKASGVGISGLPWTIPVRVGQHAGRWRDITWLALRDQLPVSWSCAFTAQEATAS